MEVKHETKTTNQKLKLEAVPPPPIRSHDPLSKHPELHSCILKHKQTAPSSSVSHPEFEGAVIRAGGNELSVRRQVQSHHFTFVSCQSLQRRPPRVSPHFSQVVVSTR